MHGDDGMADLGMPAPTLRPDPRPAIDLLRDTIEAAAAAGAPVTVVPLAPMTNLALLARVHPQAFARIGRIVFMGGGVDISNATAAAEFNVFHDPEAAAIVLAACAEHDVPVTMYGLDVFYDPLVTDVQVEALRELDTPVAAPRRRPDLVPPPPVRQRGRDDRRRRRGRHPHRAGCRAHRAAAGAGRAHRHLVARPHRRRPPRLERRPRARPARRWRPRMVDVALGVDGPRIADLWLRTVAGGGVDDGRVLVLGSLNVDLVTRVERHPRPGETVLGDGLRPPRRRQGRQPGRGRGRRRGERGDGRLRRRRRRRRRLRGPARARCGIDVSGVRIVRGRADRHALITVVDDGENSIVVIPGANDLLDEREVAAVDALGPGDVLLVQLEVPRAVVCTRGAPRGRPGARVVLNTAPYAALPPDVVALADPVVANEHEMAALAEAGAEPRSLLVTFGANGAAWDGVTAPAHEVAAAEVVDTTGAGDAFCGALAASLAGGADREQALDAALAAGAAAVRHTGAQPDPAL